VGVDEVSLPGLEMVTTVPASASRDDIHLGSTHAFESFFDDEVCRQPGANLLHFAEAVEFDGLFFY
jgi:hypothetical protein